MKSPLFKLLLIATLLFSCKKESSQSGNGSIGYTSSYEYPLGIKPAGFIDRLVLENANPYAEILGQIATSINASTTNGKPNKFSDIQVSNTHVSSAVVNVASQQAFIQAHLTDSKIVFKSTNSETTIATFSSYSNNKINYTLSNTDLTAIFKDASSGSFYIHFDFDSNAAPDDILVYYNLYFDYDYTVKQYSK